MLKVADVHVLRHLVLVDGLSQREVAKRLGISRNTVKRYLRDDVVAEVRDSPPARPKPIVEAIRPQVEELLRTARTTAKQRLTAPRVQEILQAEGHVASVRTVRRVMREWRRQRAEVSIPLLYKAGEVAQVDFFEVVVDVGGVEDKAWMFVMRMMYSGRDYARLYRWQDLACFVDGHVGAFEHFDCVPQRIVYDNLRAAVKKVLVGSKRQLNDRFVALAAHYGFDPRFARVRRGDDKGGVEARGKGIRYQHLSPIPQGPSLQAINDRLLERLDHKMQTKTRGRGRPTVSQLWPEEQLASLSLPPRRHDPGILHDVVVNRSALIRVRTAWYSVPCGWQGLAVSAWLYADTVLVQHGGQDVVHPRQPGNGKRVWYPHYLPELARKAQALEQVGDALAEQLGGAFERLWRWLVRERGRQAASRAFRAVLRAIEDQGEAMAARAVQRALDTGEDPVLAVRVAEVAPKSRLPMALKDVVVEASDLAAYGRLGGAP